MTSKTMKAERVMVRIKIELPFKDFGFEYDGWACIDDIDNLSMIAAHIIDKEFKRRQGMI